MGCSRLMWDGGWRVFRVVPALCDYGTLDWAAVNPALMCFALQKRSQLRQKLQWNLIWYYLNLILTGTFVVIQALRMR